MKAYSKKMNWHYYAITFAVATAFFCRMGFRPLQFRDFIFSGYSVEGHVIILIISFAIAFCFGLKNTYLKWLYPISVAWFMHFVLPIMALIIRFQRHLLYEFMYYLLYGLIMIFLPHLIVPLLGMGFGLLARKLST